MASVRKKEIITRLGLVLWAMATLVLCFVVVLLINEMFKAGEDPLAIFQPETDEWRDVPVQENRGAGALGTREITLYFVHKDGHALAPEAIIIEHSAHTVKNCRAALQHLISGPKQDFLVPLLPDQARIRALYLRASGELVIDLSSEMMLAHYSPRSAEMEALMVYGIVNTMVQPGLQGEDDAEVRTVRFLYNGVSPQESFLSHIDLRAPLVQDLRWTRADS